MPRRPPTLLSALILCASLVLPGCGQEEVVEPKEIVRPVKLLEFGSAEASGSHSYPGQVYANRTVDVAFEVAGRLEELPVTKGQEVKRGDLLGRLDQRDFRNELAAAMAAVEEARATLGRFEDAARSNAVSRREVDEARARKRIAEADLKIDEKQLEDSEIRASFDGVVADRLVDNFQNVQAKQPVLRLQDISILEIRVNVPEADVAGPADVPVGTLVATFDTMPGREFNLDIKEFVSEADPVTQTYAVTLMMPRPEDVEILPGMTTTVTWTPDGIMQQSSSTLPASAVVGQQGRSPWVWLVDRESMTVSRREVEVGSLVQQNQIQVLSGLEVGDVVATAGVHHLSEGMKVREY